MQVRAFERYITIRSLIVSHKWKYLSVKKGLIITSFFYKCEMHKYSTEMERRFIMLYLIRGTQSDYWVKYDI